MKNFVNFNERESIGGILARTVSAEPGLTNFLTFNHSQQRILKETITIGPNSKLTLTCDDTWTGPYLSFDSIDWEKISYVDIKSNSFLTGTGQKVLNQVISNQKKRIVLHLCINNTSSDPHEEIIQEISKYFLNLNIRRQNKILYLEYVMRQSYDSDFCSFSYLELLKKIQNKFYEIELWTMLDQMHDGEVKIERWNY